jgi:hypothetical protein
VPGQQSLRRDDRRDLRQSAPAEPLGSGSEPTALVIRATNSAAAELLAQNPILLTEIVDCLLLLLIHPARDRDQHEPERIENAHRSTVSCGIATKRLFGLFSARSILWTVRGPRERHSSLSGCFGGGDRWKQNHLLFPDVHLEFGA